MSAQSRKASLAEALTNTAVGFGVSLGANAVLLPTVGCHISTAQSAFLVVCFTVLSIARGYLLRRWFEFVRVRGDRKERSCF